MRVWGVGLRVPGEDAARPSCSRRAPVSECCRPFVPAPPALPSASRPQRSRKTSQPVVSLLLPDSPFLAPLLSPPSTTNPPTRAHWRGVQDLEGFRAVWHRVEDLVQTRACVWMVSAIRASTPQVALCVQGSGFISHKVFLRSFCKSRFPHKSVNFF